MSELAGLTMHFVIPGWGRLIQKSVKVLINFDSFSYLAIVTPECLSMMNPISLMVVLMKWLLNWSNYMHQDITSPQPFQTCRGEGSNESDGMKTLCLGCDLPTTSIFAKSSTTLSTLRAAGGGLWGLVMIAPFGQGLMFTCRYLKCN